MDPEPPGDRADAPGPGVCVVGHHKAVVVWAFGPPILPRRLCAVHIARAVTNAWHLYIDQRFRGLTE